MKGVKGEIIAGRYRVGDQVGTGGFGTVFAGRQMNLERDVAIKVMRRGPEGAAVSRERFRREAVLSSSFSHPNIVTYHDFLIDDDGDMILVMEFLRGVTLDRLLARDGRMAIDRAARIVAGVASGLAECHRAGIVHRDIKPSNIFILDDGTARERAKIIDFGILWSMPDFGTDMPGLTRENAFIGTPEYVAPEVLIGAYPDGRTDQYALALVTLRAVTGEMPFPDSKGRAILDRMTARPAALDSSLLAGAPAVRGALYKALSPEPGDRFDDMDVFGRVMASAAGVHSAAEPLQLPGAFPMHDVFGDETVVEIRKSASGGGGRNAAGVGGAGTGTMAGERSAVIGRRRGFRKTATVAAAVTVCLCAAIAVVAYMAVARDGGGAGTVDGPAVRPPVNGPASVVSDPHPAEPVPAPGAAQSVEQAAPVVVPTVAPVAAPEPAPPAASEPAPSAARVTKQAAPAPGRGAAPAAIPARAAPEVINNATAPIPVATPATASGGGEGFLKVQAVPWAKYKLDGREMGITSGTQLTLSAGRHTIELYRDGFVPQTKTVNIEAGQQLLETVEMKPITTGQP